MPALIIGGYGQVGTSLRDVIVGKYWATSRKAGTDARVIPLDLRELVTDPAIARRLFARYEIDVVFIVGALTNVDACESDAERAHEINCVAPGIVAEEASKKRIKCVYISTDYVFDGVAGPYDEEATPHPLSVYGRSKLAGERAVRSHNGDSLIVRTTVVYGPDAGRKNFVYRLAGALRNRERLETANDQFSTPTYSIDLARAVIQLLAIDAVGIYNVAGPDVISRTEFAQRVADSLQLDRSTIVGRETSALHQSANRPLRAGLLTTKLKTELPAAAMRGIEDAIADWQQRGMEV